MLLSTLQDSVLTHSVPLLPTSAHWTGLFDNRVCRPFAGKVAIELYGNDDIQVKICSQSFQHRRGADDVPCLRSRVGPPAKWLHRRST